MTTYIAGAQNTGVILQAERKVDIPPELEWLRPDNSPLVMITKGGKPGSGLPIKKRVAINPKFSVIEKEPHGVFTAINYGAGYTAGAVTLVCDDVTHINVRQVLKVVGGECLLVTSKSNGDNTITVTRGFGATAAGTIADNVPLYSISSANEEFAPYGNILQVQNRSRTNYCGIIETDVGLSRTLRNSEMYHGKKEPELNREGYLEHDRKIERAFLFSEPYEDLTGGPTNGNPIRATGGVDYWIVSGGGNVTTATTTFTMAMWLTFLRTGFEYGSDEKVFLCASYLCEMFDVWKNYKLEFRNDETLYNLKVARWATSQGEVFIVKDKELKNSSAGSGTGYGKVGYLLDPANLEYRYLQNSDTAFYKNVVMDGSDGFKHKYISEVGLGLSLPETHSKLDLDDEVYSATQ